MGETPKRETPKKDAPEEEAPRREAPKRETPTGETEKELLRLAGEVTDGRPVDWAGYHAADPDATSWIQDLLSIAAMAEAMRQEFRPVPQAPRLAPGSTLGRFRIEREAKSGGMGIVYLAHDQVLDRPVALKLLPPDVVHSPARLAQLAHEARLLASMNHPNIATIHGMEDGDAGLRFLVLEWVPGETLADRLRGGPLPLRDALEVCGQIAQALTTAHSGGLIHRDLKPANVMFATGGRVKIVDFGLARRRDLSGASLPGETQTIAGTWGYLSPESLKGADDHRADIFAFGCVLYECLTATPAFPGATAEEIHEAVLHSEPDPSVLPADCSTSIRRLIAACVRKDPEQRLASMVEASHVIEATLGRRILTHSSSETKLPRPATSFIGRGAELDRCRKLLGPGRLLTLTGAGGAGKTRLALAIAEAVEPAFEDGAWFVDLVPIQDGARVAEALATGLGVRDDPSVPTLERVTRHLGGTRALVVLDNCEHVAEACADVVRELIACCPGVSVLATSRAPFHIAEEQTVSVDPLPVPAATESDDPASLARCDSVCLFVERAAEADPNFVPDSAALQSVAEICRRVEGLPLAIELAAARVRVLSLGEIATRLDHQIQLLRDSTGRMAPRHRALHAAIAWSVEQLRPEERLAFLAFAAFSGGWDLEAASQVCGAKDEFETLDLISSLVDKSLVSVVHPKATAASRYRYLEPVRQFALGELAASDEHQAVRRRHVDYFLRLAEESEPLLYRPEQGDWFDRLAADHANFLAALEECYRDDDGIERGLRLAGALGRYWHVRGFAELGTSQLDRMLCRDGANVPNRARAHALSMAGALATWRDKLDQAIERLEEALTIFRALDDRRGEARVLLTLGPVYCNVGDTERGQRASEQGLEASRDAGDLRGVATALINLGVLAYGRGDKVAAHRLLGEAADLHRKSGDRLTLALALGNRSALSVHLGNHAAARSELTEALQLSLELDAVWGGTSAIATAGMLAMGCGDGESATWMLGAVTSCVDKGGLGLSPSQRHEMDQMVAQAQLSLEEASFDRAWCRGHAMTFPEAAAEVLQWLARQTDLASAEGR